MQLTSLLLSVIFLYKIKLEEWSGKCLIGKQNLRKKVLRLMMFY